MTCGRDDLLDEHKVPRATSDVIRVSATKYVAAVEAFEQAVEMCRFPGPNGPDVHTIHRMVLQGTKQIREQATILIACFAPSDVIHRLNIRGRVVMVRHDGSDNSFCEIEDPPKKAVHTKPRYIPPAERLFLFTSMYGAKTKNYLKALFNR